MKWKLKNKVESVNKSKLPSIWYVVKYVGFWWGVIIIKHLCVLFVYLFQFLLLWFSIFFKYYPLNSERLFIYLFIFEVISV